MDESMKKYLRKVFVFEETWEFEGNFKYGLGSIDKFEGQGQLDYWFGHSCPIVM